MTTLGAYDRSRAAHGPAKPQPAHHPERHFAAFAHRYAMARPAGARRSSRDGSSWFYCRRAPCRWADCAALRSQVEERNQASWSVPFVDVPILRAYQHAVGACLTGAIASGSDALGRLCSRSETVRQKRSPQQSFPWLSPGRLCRITRLRSAGIAQTSSDGPFIKSFPSN